jgi:3-oxoacyl-[acyl-carrier protein] reductase
MNRSFCESFFNLSGKRALVTGAGRGIGKAIAEGFAISGALVIVHYNKSSEAAEEVVRGIKDNDGEAFSVQADLTEPTDVDRMFTEIENKVGALDILVNNAGDLIERSLIADFPDDLADRVIKVNFSTAFLTSKRAIPLLRRGSEPSIINLSSVAAHSGGGGGNTLYGSMKGAVHSFTRGLAKELAPEIRVNGIAPGVIMTDFHRIHNTKERLEAIAAQTPLRRIGEPEEIAAAAVYLTARSGAFLTGEIIEVNGGLMMS